MEHTIPFSVMPVDNSNGVRRSRCVYSLYACFSASAGVLTVSRTRALLGSTPSDLDPTAIMFTYHSAGVSVQRVAARAGWGFLEVKARTCHARSVAVDFLFSIGFF